MVVGIVELKKTVSFVCELGNAAGVALEDGKIGFSDLGVLLQVSRSLGSLAEIDFAQQLPELKNLDAAEFAEIADLIKAKLDLPEHAIESKIIEVLDKAKVLAASIGAVVALIKSLKGVVA